MTDSNLTQLALAMTRLSQNHPSLDTGYTYIGQFIAHDIVPSTQPHPEFRDVTKELNLDSIYGAEDERKRLCDAEGRFLIHSPTDGNPDDLLRDPTGKALIPEGRNDENTIVAQLHLFWQKFHNFLIDKEYANDTDEAQKLTTLVCQLVIVEDYLRQILVPSVFEAYFHSTPKRWLTLDRLKIPAEFARAAFRFGHSMARPSYNSIGPANADINLEDLFRTNMKLTARHTIKWEGFYGWPLSKGIQNAMLIDPWITPTFSRLPGGQDLTTNLILRNLQAGVALPTGIEYVKGVETSPNSAEISEKFGLKQLTDLGELSDKADGIYSIEQLPLWPYVLLEAWQQMDSQRLGPLGSLICAEVLRDSIESAKYSIYEADPYGIKEVLTQLGTLGGELQEVISRNEESCTEERPFCMRHVIELIA